MGPGPGFLVVCLEKVSTFGAGRSGPTLPFRPAQTPRPGAREAFNGAGPPRTLSLLSRARMKAGPHRGESEGRRVKGAEASRGAGPEVRFKRGGQGPHSRRARQREVMRARGLRLAKGSSRV